VESAAPGVTAGKAVLGSGMPAGTATWPRWQLAAAVCWFSVGCGDTPARNGTTTAAESSSTTVMTGSSSGDSPAEASAAASSTTDDADTETPPETTSADASTSSGLDSSTGDSGGSEYAQLCTAYADKLAKCLPDTADPGEQYRLCVKLLGDAEATSDECLAATEGLVACRSTATCDELLNSDSCVDFDNMIEKLC
jgi:hypothetical protein